MVSDGKVTRNPIKKWGVLAYIVAEPPPGYGGAQTLNPAAREEVRECVQAAVSLGEDMYCAYQLDYGDTIGIYRDVAGSVQGPQRIYEPRDSEPGDPTILKRFFEWARYEIPAERYAVFFWGHTFGPASLFAPPLRGRRVLGLPELRVALSTFEKKMDLEVVLFKDCWMSTLETACELRDVAKFVIASQGLVPILPVWPYRYLFKDLVNLADGAAPTDLVIRLGKLYDQPGNRGPLEAVPFALLDLKKMDQVSVALEGLVSELSGGGDNHPKAAGHVSAIERARIGDIALADVRTLCDNLQGESSSKEANKLDVAVSHLVSQQYSQTPGYRGVSIFYYPSQQAKQRSTPRERFIWPLLPYSWYTELRLAQATKWEEVGYEQLLPTESQNKKEHPMEGKDPEFGPEEVAQIVHLTNALHRVTNKRVISRTSQTSASDYSAILTDAINELLTNIQELDKSISNLTKVMNQINERAIYEKMP
jgi:hypothetical protein